VKFFETDNSSATFDLAHVPAMYNMGLHAKFRGRTLCRLEFIGGRNSQI